MLRERLSSLLLVVLLVLKLGFYLRRFWIPRILRSKHPAVLLIPHYHWQIAMTITPQHLIAPLPLLIVGLTVVVVMLSIAWRRTSLPQCHAVGHSFNAASGSRFLVCRPVRRHAADAR